MRVEHGEVYQPFASLSLTIDWLRSVNIDVPAAVCGRLFTQSRNLC
jgi:hypothetical protein